MGEAKEASGDKADPIPFGKFFQNGSFWALMAAHFTWNYFSYGLLAWLPSFLSSALNVTLTKSSFLSILPYLATVAVTTIVAPTADSWEKNGMTRTNVRKLSQTLCFGMGAWVRTGLFCGHQDMSPKYASIMLGITNTAAAIASTLSTFFTGYFFSISGGSWGWS